MRILFDTSILVASCVQSHPHHNIAISWLQKAHKKSIKLLITSHSLAEIFSVLTRLPVSPKISTDMAQYLIQHNIAPYADIEVLTVDHYYAAIKRVSQLGLSGGIIYDALIVEAAKNANADYILTLNMKDFLRLTPEKPGWVTNLQEG